MQAARHRWSASIRLPLSGALLAALAAISLCAEDAANQNLRAGIAEKVTAARQANAASMQQNAWGPAHGDPRGRHCQGHARRLGRLGQRGYQKSLVTRYGATVYHPPTAVVYPAAAASGWAVAGAAMAGAAAASSSAQGGGGGKQPWSGQTHGIFIGDNRTPIDATGAGADDAPGGRRDTHLAVPRKFSIQEQTLEAQRAMPPTI